MKSRVKSTLMGRQSTKFKDPKEWIPRGSWNSCRVVMEVVVEIQVEETNERRHVKALNVDGGA